MLRIPIPTSAACDEIPGTSITIPALALERTQSGREIRFDPVMMPALRLLFLYTICPKYLARDDSGRALRRRLRRRRDRRRLSLRRELPGADREPRRRRGQERQARGQAPRLSRTHDLASACEAPPERRQRSTCSAIAASGGSVNSSEAGSPCQGSAAAATPPMLPTPDPPYVSASVLRISRHRPSAGTPTRYLRRGTGVKLHATSTGSPPSGSIRSHASTLCARSSATTQRNPSAVGWRSAASCRPACGRAASAFRTPPRRARSAG
jgi:hypothetical protein